MKRIFAIIISAVMAISTLTGCSNSADTAKENTEEKKLSILSTQFASYDFARQIVGDKAEVTLLIPPGSESHTYEPTPQDIMKINKCDIFIYNGGESEAWIKDVLGSVKNENMKTIAMTECVEVVEEETVEGMENEHERGEETEHDKEFDEHVWASPKNAIRITKDISKLICDADEGNRDLYLKNEADYVKKLEALDTEFEDVVKNGKRKLIVFGDRFPLRYFVDAYGLNYYAAFPGCASNAEPSASTVAFLIDKVKAEKIPVVFHIELSNEKMADTISEATGAKKLLFNACHNVSKDDFQKGVTYLELMEGNVSALKEALS